MIIDILKLKQEPGATKFFSFDYAADNAILGLPDAGFLGDVKVECEATVKGRDLFVDLSVSYAVVAPCSRCLDSAETSVNYFSSVKFTLFPEEDAYLYKSGRADLTPAVKEAILLSQPSVIYCKPDCKGLCPVCGANLNDGDCGHSE